MVNGSTPRITGGDGAREENIADEGERVGGGRQIGQGGLEGGVGAAARVGPGRRGEQVRIPSQILGIIIEPICDTVFSSSRTNGTNYYEKRFQEPDFLMFCQAPVLSKKIVDNM